MVIGIIFDCAKRDGSGAENKILCLQFSTITFLIVYIYASHESFSFQCQWSFRTVSISIG